MTNVMADFWFQCIESEIYSFEFISTILKIDLCKKTRFLPVFVFARGVG